MTPGALQVTRKVDILTPLGALYYNTGRYEEALQVYREAATLQPDSTDIWLALVSSHTHTHRCTSVKQGIGLVEPTNPHPLVHAVIYVELGYRHCLA